MAVKLIDETLDLLAPYIKKAKSDGKGVDIMGIGNPLLDISNTVSQAFCDKYGIRVDNAILAEEKHLPMYEELCAMKGTEYIAGGATLNAVRVAKWMLSDSGSVAYSGCIGKDDYGKRLTDLVTKQGLQSAFMISEKSKTGTCAVCIVEKERSLVANLAAANDMDSSHLKKAEVSALLNSAQVIYTAGFLITSSSDSMLLSAQTALEKGKVYALNLSAEFIVSVFKEPLSKVIPYTSFIFGNKEELKAYVKANEVKCKSESMADLALAVSALPCLRSEGRTVVCTQGSESVIIARKGETVKTFSVPELDKSKIVDLNGAGDAFVGGFLSQFVRGKPTETCVKAGNYAAQYIIQKSGCALSGKPTFEA